MAEKLTEAQTAAIKFSRYGKAGGDYYCTADDITRRSTIAALVRKGYVHDNGNGYRFFLTEKGERLRHFLKYEVCEGCGLHTHENEAACISCGKLKSWADDDEPASD